MAHAVRKAEQITGSARQGNEMTLRTMRCTGRSTVG